MGFIIDDYYPPLSIKVDKGIITCTDVFGNIFEGSTHKSITLDLEKSKVPKNLKAYGTWNKGNWFIDKEERLILTSLSENGTVELYANYNCKLNEELTKCREYRQIGYYIKGKSLLCLMQDVKMPSLVHIVSSNGDLNSLGDKHLLIEGEIPKTIALKSTYAYALDLLKEKPGNVLVVIDSQGNLCNLKITKGW